MESHTVREETSLPLRIKMPFHLPSIRTIPISGSSYSTTIYVVRQLKSQPLVHENHITSVYACLLRHISFACCLSLTRLSICLITKLSPFFLPFVAFTTSTYTSPIFQDVIFPDSSVPPSTLSINRDSCLSPHRSPLGPKYCQGCALSAQPNPGAVVRTIYYDAPAIRLRNRQYLETCRGFAQEIRSYRTARASPDLGLGRCGAEGCFRACGLAQSGHARRDLQRSVQPRAVW